MVQGNNVQATNKDRKLSSCILINLTISVNVNTHTAFRFLRTKLKHEIASEDRSVHSNNYLLRLG